MSQQDTTDHRKPSLYAITYKGLMDHFLENNIPKYRTQQVFHHLYKRWITQLSDMNNIPKTLIQHLEERFHFFIPKILTSQVAKDKETTKLLLELEDHKTIETVLIQSEERTTQCLSSQVGCPLKCRFCATGTKGYKRNLTTEEIIAQIQIATLLNQTPTNFVFMGMGEPLLNAESVLQAIQVLHDEEGAGIGVRRFTISTSGIIKGIERIIRESLNIRLAVSLNSPDVIQRTEIMPVTKANPLADLLKVLREYQKKTHLRITFEYVLLDGVNNSYDHARLISRILKPFLCYVNIIPFNPFPGSIYKRPNQDSVRQFYRWLKDEGLQVIQRYHKGGSIAAACGQLLEF